VVLLRPITAIFCLSLLQLFEQIGEQVHKMFFCVSVTQSTEITVTAENFEISKNLLAQRDFWSHRRQNFSTQKTDSPVHSVFQFQPNVFLLHLAWHWISRNLTISSEQWSRAVHSTEEVV